MDNQIKPYYYDSCHGDETIVFLHGLGASSLSWEYQVDYFKASYRLIVPDIRGHGKSALGAESYSFEGCADDIYVLLQRLDIKKVHLCGFSFGGMVAFEFAVKYPDMLLSFCAVNVLAHFELNSPDIHLLYQLRRALARIFPLKWLSYFMGLTLFPNKKDAHLRRKMLHQSVFMNRTGYIHALDAMRGWNLEEELEKIKVPTLLVGSEFDYSIFKDKEALAKKMPNASYHEIKGAHHFVIWECADEFNLVYKSFLDSL